MAEWRDVESQQDQWCTSLQYHSSGELYVIHTDQTSLNSSGFERGEILEKQMIETDMIHCSKSLFMWQILVLVSACSLLVFRNKQLTIMLNIFIIAEIWSMKIIGEYRWCNAIIDPVHASSHPILELQHPESMYIHLLIYNYWHYKTQITNGIRYNQVSFLPPLKKYITNKDFLVGINSGLQYRYFHVFGLFFRRECLTSQLVFV